MEEVGLGMANLIEPEGHDLHQTTGSGRGQGIVVKSAFYLHDGENQFGFEVGSMGFRVDGFEDFDAALGVWDAFTESVGHIDQPDFGGITVGERGRGRNGSFQQRPQCGAVSGRGIAMGEVGNKEAAE